GSNSIVMSGACSHFPSCIGW
ncbi:hypothetical protein BIW11_03399, partial [Tropilaelaps mercedesae]